jgi:hypothetical protein
MPINQLAAGFTTFARWLTSNESPISQDYSCMPSTIGMGVRFHELVILSSFSRPLAVLPLDNHVPVGPIACRWVKRYQWMKFCTILVRLKSH